MEKELNNIIYTSAVDENNQGLRIDKFIASDCKQFSRAQVQRLILGGFVFCDDEIVSDKDFKTRLNDVYQIIEPDPIEAQPAPENIPLDVLYEDEHLIVINKPKGMTVHPGAGNYAGTLVNALLFHCKNSLSGIGGVARPGIVHRIDKNTSGVLVVAKNDLTHNGLAEQFYHHSIERTYFALTYNVPMPLKGRIEGNIARSSFDRKKMALVKTGGKHAVTHYETIENYNNSASLIKCNLETGRTHQIRVHLSSIGCHLIGDDLYKGKKSTLRLPEDARNEVLNFNRQALHAYSLGFIHPITKQYMEFRSDFPDDMNELINTLRKHKL